MNSAKLETLITENMKSIFGFALTRTGNTDTAEELASDILYEIVRSHQNLKDEERFYGFMWKIAENTYVDYLRKKSRISGKTEELDPETQDNAESVLDGIIRAENLNLLRRELSLLSEMYRKVTVMHYMDSLTCAEIASALGVSAEMVKFYLFRARKMIREGMDMERLYGKKSYRPSIFEIDFWGTLGGEDSEYCEFERRKIKGNILLAAYYTPVSAQEIGVELGVSLPYLEDEIKILTDRMYLVNKGGKYLTNIPIFTLECTDEISEKLQSLTSETAEKFAALADKFKDVHGGKFKNENLLRWQKLLLCLNFSLLETDEDIGKTYGGLPKDGPYSIVNGGGGSGFIWGRSREISNKEEKKIHGIYESCPSSDGRGTVAAMNFAEVLNAQEFSTNFTDPIVCTAVDCFEYLPEDWQKTLTDFGYAVDGKPNFFVYTEEEYKNLREILRDGIDLISDLYRNTVRTAAKITADFAPAHIKNTAEYVGAFIYRFTAIEKLTTALFDAGFLKPVDDTDKPAMYVVRYV